MIKDYLLFVLRQMEDIQNEGEYMEFDEIYDKLQWAIDELDVVLDMLDMDMLREVRFEKFPKPDKSIHTSLIGD